MTHVFLHIFLSLGVGATDSADEVQARELWKQVEAHPRYLLPGFLTPEHKALKDLIKQGEAAIPCLREALASPRKLTRRNAAVALSLMKKDGQATLEKALKAPDWQSREAAIIGWIVFASASCSREQTLPQMIEEIKPFARTATDLLRHDSDWQVRAAAAEALENVCGVIEHVVPDLRTALKDENREVRRHVLKVAARMGSHASALATDVVAMLKDSSESVCEEALAALAKITEPSDYLSAVLELIRNDPNPAVRGATAKALAGFGSRAKSLVPAVLESIQFRGHFESAAGENMLFIKAFGAVGPEAKDAIPFLNEFLVWRVDKDFADDRVIECLEATFALAKIGHRSERMIEVMLQHLEQKDAPLDHACLRTLAAIGPYAGKAIDGLEQMLAREKRENERRLLSLALIGIRCDQSALFQKQLEAARSDYLINEEFGTGLQTMPLKAAKAVPALAAVIKRYPEVLTGTDGVRKRLAMPLPFDQETVLVDQLARFGREARNAAPVLVEILSARVSPKLQMHAALALVNMGEWEKGGDNLVRSLQAAAEEDNGISFSCERFSFETSPSLLLRLNAVAALLRIGKCDSEKALPLLMTNAKQYNWAARAAAVRGLGMLSTKNKDVLILLRQQLDHESDEVRSAAGEALDRPAK